MLSPDTINAVKSLHEIASIIHSFVPLKKRGRHWVGLCPFHSEKSPSFTVSDEKGFWYCFGCHESGDLITFIQKIESVNFTDAVRWIATKTGIEIIEIESTPTATVPTVMDAIQAAHRIFIDALHSHANAQDYLHDRGLTEKTIQQFQLGFCPSHLQLRNQLRNHNISDDLIEKSGLLISGAQGEFCRFRHRIIFPISDIKNRTLGFAGRIMETPSTAAKYLNSEESDHFAKRRILWGLHRAKHGIEHHGHAILMEGYIDVMMAHQYGFTQCIASMGTALASEQVSLLKRFTTTIYLMLDKDQAGITATEKNYRALAHAGFKVRVIQYHHKDPADLLTQEGTDGFKAAMSGAIHPVEFKLQTLLETHNIADTGVPSQLLEAILPDVRMEQDKITKNQLIYHISKSLYIDLNLVVEIESKLDYNRSKARAISQNIKENRYIKAEEILVYWSATNQEVRKQILEKVGIEAFSKPEHIYLMTAMKNCPDTNVDLISKIEEVNHRKLLSQILIKGEMASHAKSEQEWKDCINLIQSKTKSEHISDIRKQIQQAERDGASEEVITTLMVELSRLISNHGEEDVWYQ